MNRRTAVRGTLRWGLALALLAAGPAGVGGKRSSASASWSSGSRAAGS